MARVEGRPRRLVAGLLLGLAFRSAVNFAMPVGGGRSAPVSSKQQGGARKARDDMPRQNSEIKEPEEEPDVEPAPEMPDRRAPYEVKYYIHSDHAPDQDKQGTNFKYLSSKLEAALENCQDMIQKVDVRLNIESNAHKTVSGSKKTVTSVSEIIELGDGEEFVVPTGKSSSEERKILSPYRMEVTVKMIEGYMVLSKSQHAQGSFTEVVDHMYDMLRRQMRKEKEKKIKATRKASTNDVEFDAGDPMEAVDRQMQDLDQEEQDRLDAEAEAEYALTEEGYPKPKKAPAPAPAPAAKKDSPAPAPAPAAKKDPPPESDLKDLLR